MGLKKKLQKLLLKSVGLGNLADALLVDDDSETFFKTRKFLNIMDQLPIGVIITDDRGKIEYSNREFEKNTGFRLRDIHGETPALLKSGHHPPSFYQQMWQAISSGKIFQDELLNRRKDGSLYWVSLTISPVLDEKGRITQYVGLQTKLENITKINARLKESEEIYRKLIQVLPLPMYIHINGVIQFANNAGSRLVGYDSPRELIGRPALDFVDYDYREIVQARMKRLMEKREQVPPAHEMFVGADGTRIPVRVIATPVIFQEQNAVMILAEDISQEREYRQKIMNEKMIAQNALRVKKDFLAQMSHEFRTPLNSIIGFSNILSEKVNDPDALDLLSRLQKNGLQLLNMINEILELAKLESQPVRILYKPINLSAFVKEIITLAEPLVGDKPVEIKAEIPDDAPLLETAPETLRIILINLIGNAIKFTEKGFVRVRAEERNGRIYALEVEDSGIGIDKKDAKRIFNAFEQVESGFSRKYEGTGLGLSIVKELSDQLGIQIELESTPNVGTKFRLLFP